jgi:hypothetical protein
MNRLTLYEEQRIRHLLMFEELEDQIPSHFFSCFCTLAGPLVFRIFGVRCELFGYQPKFKPSTLRKQKFYWTMHSCQIMWRT